MGGLSFLTFANFVSAGAPKRKMMTTPDLTPLERLEMTNNDLYWIPPHVTIHDEPEAIWTSYGEDSLNHNSLYWLSARHPDPGALLSRIRETHASVRSRWTMIPSARTPALEALAKDFGYEPTVECDACVTEVADWKPRVRSSIHVEAVVTVEALRAMVELAEEVFGRSSGPKPSDDELRRQLALSLVPNPRTMRFLAYDAPGGKPIGSAGLAINTKASIGLLWGGATREAYRGRGVYAALVAARMKVFQERLIRCAGLFARVDTSAPIMMKQGFQSHGRMKEWVRPKKA
jgi:hypothetical protein